MISNQMQHCYNKTLIKIINNIKPLIKNLCNHFVFFS